jgi:hypothetical protein
MQTAGIALVPSNSVRNDASASALSTTRPLHESCYGRFGLYAEAGQSLIAQDAFVPATQACHLHDELGGRHD